MKVTYTSEQKRVAIQTYRRVKSYAKTIQILGYPSYHVLIDWVKGVSHGRPNKVGHVSPHHYSWQTKWQAVDSAPLQLTAVKPIFGIATS